MRETSKPRPHGYVFYRETTGKWYARLTYIVKATGNRREIIRTARDEAHANQILADLVASFDQIREQDAPQLPPEPIVSAPDDFTLPTTFKQLAAHYSEHKVKPATYRNDHKVSGLRSERTVKLRIQALVDYFGDTAIERITVAAIERFKSERLNQQTRNKKERSITDVNRTLEVLRSILRYARNEGIIQVSPFERSSMSAII